MSDPQPDRLNSKPTRAEPLQPDKPGQGNASQDDAGKREREVEEAAVKKQKEQTDTALTNVSKATTEGEQPGADASG